MSVPLNDGLMAVCSALSESEYAQVLKRQPPDGVVIELADGSVFALTAHPTGKPSWTSST